MLMPISNIELHQDNYFAANLLGHWQDCSPGCGACCIVPEIKNPDGTIFKHANQRCKHLSVDNSCRIHSSKDRPQECRDFSCRAVSIWQRTLLQQFLDEQ